MRAQQLAGHRSERQASPHGQPEQAQGEPAAVLGRQVDGPGRPRCVDRPLARADHQPGHDERGDAVGDQVEHAADRHRQRAGDEHDAPAAPIGLPARQRTADDRRQGERADDDPDRDVAGVQRPPDVGGQHRQRRADRQEGHQCREEHPHRSGEPGVARGQTRAPGRDRDWGRGDAHRRDPGYDTCVPGAARLARPGASPSASSTPPCGLAWQPGSRAAPAASPRRRGWDAAARARLQR